MGSESQDREILRRLIGIDHKADSMQDSLAWIVRANAGELKQQLLSEFGASKRRAQVYLALDGTRTVNDVAEHLSMKRQNVTGELKTLKRLRLVDIVESDGRGTIYCKKFFDAVVGLSGALMTKFNLDPSGEAIA